MEIVIIAFFIITVGLFMFSSSSLSKIDEIKRKQLSCNHDFKYKQNVGHEGDVLMHQYECAKCGRNTMETDVKKCFVVTHTGYIGETPFDKVFSDRDIITVCESFEDANEFIDSQIQYNVDAYNRENGKGVITHEVRRPEFYEGRSVEVLFHNMKDNKKWLWTYDIFERNMYVSKKKKS